MAQKPDVKVTIDRVDEVLKAINDLAGKKVLVGIPSTTAGRKSGSITNAVIGYVMENGLPSHNVPARPFLVPGVRSVQDKINKILFSAGQAALEGKKKAVEQYFNALGLMVVSAVRQKLSTGPFQPLAESTVRGRLRQTQAGRRRLAQLVSAGSDLYKWGIANLRPLINTGQLRNAITYVIRSGKVTKL